MDNNCSMLWEIFGPGAAGAVFSAGWWFWVDAVVCSDVKISFIHYLPGTPTRICLSFFMFAILFSSHASYQGLICSRWALILRNLCFSGGSHVQLRSERGHHVRLLLSLRGVGMEVSFFGSRISLWFRIRSLSMQFFFDWSLCYFWLEDGVAFLVDNKGVFLLPLAAVFQDTKLTKSYCHYPSSLLSFNSRNAILC